MLITDTTRITKTYYSAGTKLVAMRVIPSAGSALYFLHTDHPSTALRTSLGSMSLTTDGAGIVVSEQRYTAWGVVRAATGASQPLAPRRHRQDA